MVRLAEAADPGRDGWSDLKITAERLPASGDNKDPHRDCPNIGGISEQDLKGMQLIDFRLPQPVFHCDLVRVVVQNNGQRDVDVNVSYIDAASGIKPLGPDCTVTLPPGASPLVRQLWITTWDKRAQAPDTIGREHVVITAVERRDASQADLCFIQDAVGGLSRGSRRASLPGRAGWLLGALEEAALASSNTRAVQQLDQDDVPNAARAGMYLVTLQVTP
jgi:hypothetical protein